MKKEQGANRDEKGAVEIGKKERVLKKGRDQGEWGNMSKGAGSIDPPNRASCNVCCLCCLLLKEILATRYM